MVERTELSQSSPVVIAVAHASAAAAAAAAAAATWRICENNKRFSLHPAVIMIA